MSRTICQATETLNFLPRLSFPGRDVTDSSSKSPAAMEAAGFLELQATGAIARYMPATRQVSAATLAPRCGEGYRGSTRPREIEISTHCGRILVHAVLVRPRENPTSSRQHERRNRLRSHAGSMGSDEGAAHAGRKRRSINRFVVEQLIALRLAAETGDGPAITPEGRSVLLRGSPRLWDVAA